MKKGVSPLIATVLLIGFTVILAASIWFWYGRVVTEQFMKESALSAIQSDCLSDIEIQIISAELSGNTINIEIKNNGNKFFNGVQVLVNDGVDVLSVKEGFAPAEQKIIEAKTDIQENPTKVAVMPMIVRSGVPGTCSDKKQVYDLQ